MRYTIGMPSYNNFTEVWFTVQALRIYHDLKDCEIVVIDNYGDDNLKLYIEKCGMDKVKYYRFTEVQGVSYAKNRIFDVAQGDYVLVMDSHILLKPGALDVVPPDNDMIQGPLLNSNCKYYQYEWLPEWRSNMWGIWGNIAFQLPDNPKEIWAMGAGFFAVRRDSWLGFNEYFKEFGGETGYIQEKYRQAGRKVWMYPSMIWQHFFHNWGRELPYQHSMITRVRNYILGFTELDKSLDEIKEHFGEVLFGYALEQIKKEGIVL